MKLNKIICGVLGALSLVSCADKMDYTEYNIYDKDYITRNFGYVGGLMTRIYNDLDGDWGNYSGAVLGSATDESQVSHSGNAIEDFYNGAWGPSNPYSSIWTTCYDGIEYSNQVLDEFQGLTFDELVLNSDYAKQMYRYQNYKYEARWARAYFYFLLVRQYGGVPLKTRTMTAAESNALTRSSADSIFQFIDDECVAIQDSIVKDYTNLGDMIVNKPETARANKYAVMALRARAAMYYASPLFNPNNDAERWLKAAQACQALIDSCKAGGRHLSASYSQLWGATSYSDAEPYAEIIFSRRYAASRTFETYNFPTGYQSAQGMNCPTQNLVDAYDMTDGSTWAEAVAAGTASDDDMFSNRDPRLALTVAHNGEAWPTDYYANNGNMPLQTYVGGINARPTSPYGTPTSYYLKKYCNSSIILRSSSANTFAHQWITFRLGEAYLNYAECLFQYAKAQGASNAADYTNTALGFTMSPRLAASQTRMRSSIAMPAFPTGMDNDTFWKRYQNERFVELAFEGHRFFDVRRWKEAPKFFTNIVWMQITRNVTTDDTGAETESFTYKRINNTRSWDDKMYLFPIPQTEIAKSGGLIEQNPGW
ncbi:MAG: RagB/SusD family nutrient uptake outer membrane protein [Bacteroidaceae bacterium]|nr:RagB/SusD family nutrient uptake outer membrane protein [Bacteroidaceae bacterium]